MSDKKIEYFLNYYKDEIITLAQVGANTGQQFIYEKYIAIRGLNYYEL